MLVVSGAVLAFAPPTAAPVAAQDTLAKIKQRGTLIVGIKNDYKPWGFVDPSGQTVGMEIDLAKDVADRLGAKLELVPVTGANRMEFLQQGRLHLIMPPIGHTTQHRNVVGLLVPHSHAS